MAVFIPAVLETELGSFEELVYRLTPLVKEIHVDFTDNTLVGSTSLLPTAIPLLETDAKLDAHLMTNYPSRYYEDLARLGFSRVIIHLEATEDLDQAMSQAIGYGFAISLVLNPETPIDALTPLGMRIKDVQLMSVHPGFTNQPFLENIYPRISEVKRRFPHLTLAVDGGVRFNNAPTLIKAGADRLIASRHGYIENGNVATGIKKWQTLVSAYVS